MKATRLASIILTTIALVVPAQVFAAPANADPDTDFANELHTYGIYGIGIGKITCKRLYNNVDNDAYKSAQFIGQQLQKGSTTEQAWQFLGAALRTYCPEKLSILEQIAQRAQPATERPQPPAQGPPLAAERPQ